MSPNEERLRRKMSLTGVTLLSGAVLLILGAGWASRDDPSSSEIVQETRTAYKSDVNLNYNRAKIKLSGASLVKPIEYTRPLLVWESNLVNHAEQQFYRNPLRWSGSM